MSDMPTQDRASRYDRVGRLIYGMQRLGGTEGLRRLKTDPGVAPDTAKRGAALADRYDALLARLQHDVDSLGDADVEALLRDAAELVDEMGRTG